VLNVRERAAELATIRQFGWPESALTRLVVTEGALIGAAGSLAGAAAGLAAAAQFTGQFPGRLIVAAAGAALAGVLVTAVAALPPARALRSLPAARLLSEE
jgi:ABC-type antimicrobial peptide transport system permease subunit